MYFVKRGGGGKGDEGGEEMVSISQPKLVNFFLV